MPDGALGLGKTKSAGSRAMPKVRSLVPTGLRARGFRIALGLILTSLGVFPRPSQVSAQDLLVQLSNSESSAPISGAMITVTRPGDSAPIARSLTGPSGRALFDLLIPGRYLIQAEMIGFRTLVHSTEVDSLSNPLARLSMDRVAIEIEGISVAGSRRCDLRPEEGTRVAAVWEEARKALAGVEFTQAERIFRYRVLMSTSTVARDTKIRRSISRSASSKWLETPFESRPAQDLVDMGFVQPDPEGDGDLYFAPDAGVLLSDEFLDTHCFRLRLGSEDRQGMIGLVFEPKRSQRKPDINGVLWMDSQRWVLDRADFWYDNLQDDVQSVSLGGFVRFQRLPRGSWIVPEWEIRMPNLGISRSPMGEMLTSVVGTREVRGQVLRVEELSGRLLLTSAAGTLEGVVVDSLGVDPVVGARVLVEGESQALITDELGHFRMTELPAGRYTVVVEPPGSVLSDGPLSKTVDVVDGDVELLRFETPTWGEILASACGGDQGLSRGRSVLVGTVLDAGSGLPLANATVRIMWDDYQFRAQGADSPTAPFEEERPDRVWAFRMSETERGLLATTNGQGVYRACGVPDMTLLNIVAEMGLVVSLRDTVRIPEGVPVWSRDWSLHLATPGEVVGWVQDWTTDAAVAAAEVHLTRLNTDQLGVPTETLVLASDSEGGFRTGALSAGDWAIEISSPGFGSASDTIGVHAGRRTEIQIRLPTAALEIGGVTVTVRSETKQLRRVSGNAVDYVSPEEMDELRDVVSSALDVIRKKLPRVMISVGGSGRSGGALVDYCIQSTRRSRPMNYAGCQPALLSLDGLILYSPNSDDFGGQLSGEASRLLLELLPEEIESVRFLQGMEARFRYGEAGKYGALIIETRRGSRN